MSVFPPFRPEHLLPFFQVTWVVLAYLLSYMGRCRVKESTEGSRNAKKFIPGFAVIFTRLSDGIGREAAVIIAYVLFAGFSLGGGLAQTLNQLIALRVLQGVGGSGLYSMIFVIGPGITPVQYWGAFSGMIGIVLATGSVLGIQSPLMSPSAVDRLLLCNYRTHPGRGYHGKGIMAMDLSVQRSCRCPGNNDHAHLLAAERKHRQNSPLLLAVISTGGLVGCRPATVCLHATGLCAPRRWKYSIFVEQRNQCFHPDDFRGMLGWLFRLDILALVWHCSSTSGNFPFYYCTYQTNWPSYNVR